MLENFDKAHIKDEMLTKNIYEFDLAFGLCLV